MNELRLDMLDEAVDWASTTAWQGEVNPGQLKLEVDALVETELEDGAALPRGVEEGSPRGLPASSGATPTLPYVHARRLQSGDWRIEYWALNGNVTVIGRQRDQATAILTAAAHARIHACDLEVDDA